MEMSKWQKADPSSRFVLAEKDLLQLSSLAQSRSLPYALVTRAKLVLMAAGGLHAS